MNSKKWFKGNTHAHTNNSDGDSSPEFVSKWYQKHGYNFLCVSDHNKITKTENIEQDDNFIIIPSEEISDWCEGKPLHVNALGLHCDSPIEPSPGSTKKATLQNAINLAVSSGSIAQVNHPNFEWAFDSDTISELYGARLIEIVNATKDCNNFGGGGYPSVESMWDDVLSRGKLWYGIISDDSHHYTEEFTADRFNPGRGWVMVNACELTEEAILMSLVNGDFYATTGVELSKVERGDNFYSVEIIQSWGSTKYTTKYIGRDGKVKQVSYDLKSTYYLKGDEGYVRVKVEASNGEVAFTQPLML